MKGLFDFGHIDGLQSQFIFLTIRCCNKISKAFDNVLGRNIAALMKSDGATKYVSNFWDSKIF